MCYTSSKISAFSQETWLDSASEYFLDQAFDEFKSQYNREVDLWHTIGDDTRLQEIYSEIVFKYGEY